MDITITDAQLRVLRRLDPVKTAKQVVQIHIDTWLAPYVAELDEIDRKAVLEKYIAATPTVRDQVDTLLGL
jgi:hypothetical protein